MLVANNWNDYKILDMANGQKLERWGNVILSRPDPQIIWKDKSFPDKWKLVMLHIIEVNLEVAHGNITNKFQKIGR